LTDTGSHTWFPKNAFDRVEERRTSSYKDENFFLLDITDIGPKGFWIFGKKTHKKNFQNPQEDEEAYIGLFSNQRPKWLNKDSDFYRGQIKEKTEKALQAIEEDIEKKLNEDEFKGYMVTVPIKQMVTDMVTVSLRKYFHPS
jgi:hypothetical protein